MNKHGGMDFEAVRLLHASGDEDATIGGIEQQYCIDGEILGSIISGDGSSLPAVVARLGIGRAAFNKLYRVFKRKQLTQDTRLRFFETYVASTLHGSPAWVFDKQVRQAVNGWAGRMLSVITERSPHDECEFPSVAVVPRLLTGQMKQIGRDLRQSDFYPNRVSMLRTRLQIELGLVKKEDTILGHALSSIWGDHIPGVEEFITVAGGHYDQSTEAMKARDDAAEAAAVSKLSMTKWEKLQQQRHRRSEKREWGERAKRLIANLPSGGLVLD